MIRALVVEDSSTVAELLVSMLQSDPGIRVVGIARDGREAVRAAQRLTPDIITMDVNMPVMDGLAATKEIMAVTPTPIIIVSSVANRNAVELSLDATQAGALMVLPKPEGPLGDTFNSQRTQLVSMVKAMAQVKVVRQWQLRAGRVSPATDAQAIAPDRNGTRAIVIGCSTGGPAALRQLLGALPSTLPVPVFVVQHLARGFVTGLTGWLDGGTSLRVKVAEDQEAARPGTVYIAPDDRHMCLTRTARIVFSDAPPTGGFRPSVSVLFSSAAKAYGSSAMGVLLTGMGNDGVSGMKDLKEAGALLLAQDEASSVVYGMAQEAVRAGLPDAVLPLTAIAARIAQVAR